jgi:hypothetical protein
MPGLKSTVRHLSSAVPRFPIPSFPSEKRKEDNVCLPRMK